MPPLIPIIFICFIVISFIIVAFGGKNLFPSNFFPEPGHAHIYIVF